MGPASAASCLVALALLLAAPARASTRPPAAPAISAPPPASAPAAAPAAAAGGRWPEVYGFSVSADDAAFRAYDWSLLTGVGWQTDPARVAYARSRGARVELQAQGGVAEVIGDVAARRRWVGAAPPRGDGVGAPGGAGPCACPAGAPAAPIDACAPARRLAREIRLRSTCGWPSR
jgi:hypothetical protein